MTNFGTANALLTINLKKLAENYKYFHSLVHQECAVAGVIKANAYGLGAKQVAQTLKSLNCPQFFVATLDEAMAIRREDKDTPIAVLGGLMMGQEQEYLTQNIMPVLNSPLDTQNWGNFCKKQERKISAIIHFDTGMNRLGLSMDEARTLIGDESKLNPIDVRLIMSHFASADNKDDPLTAKQAKNFNFIAQYFPNIKKSLSNSSGLFRDKSYHFDMIRPGYALYGGNPTAETQNPMQNIVSLNARILQIRDCKKGESIGYSATHIFDKNTRTATIALGYADGFLRSNSSQSIVYYNNQPCPVLGRVSMDLVTINISHIKGQQPAQGEAIEILGPNQTIDDLAKTASTIGYEILTALGNRYKRNYI